MKPNPVVHFELPAEDKKRAADFYANAFGWKPQFLGPEMGEYVMVNTTEEMRQPGAINGGIYKKTDDPATHYPSIVVAVDDINEGVKKVEEAGGKTNGKIENIPGVGLFIPIIDTEGNHISILQPNEDMK